MTDELLAGRYRMLEPLGRGSMSSVWLAEDEDLGRRVAVKTLAPTADRARFEREARAVASLSHANVCALWDYGEADGRPYMVLEHLEGGTLEDRLRGGRPLPDADTSRIAHEVAAGLAQAHARGLVHRDLKPANILFDGEGRAKIADFGIARMGDAGLTETGTVLGTASYISPEQAAGEPAGPASDVYSFGVILFRMLTGRLPFAATNALELVRMHRDDPPPPVASVRPDAPRPLAEVADASLAKDPSARPHDGAALLAALAGGSAATVALPAADAATRILRPSPTAPPRNRRRTPLVAAALLVPALLAAGAVAAWLTTGSDAPSAPPPVPTLVLPTVAPGTTAPTSTALPTTTLPAATRAATTSARTTTAAPPTTTAPPPATTEPATTAPPTTAPATSVPPTATAPLPTTEPATTVATTPTTEPTTTDAAPALEPTTTAP